ncbi:hypothetical protein MW887_001090 [Aspergillus wentii]|nr:hypothetical protein MW887_001090 [Aspergillus wentii]
MRIASLLALAAFAVAETTTTVGYFEPDWNIHIPYFASTAASVADINAVATTYHIGCLSGAPTTECDIKTPWTLIQGPETMSFTGVYDAWKTGEVNSVLATRDFKCSFTSYSLSASCSLSYKVTGTTNGLSYSTSTSTKGTFATDHVAYYELKVTGGESLYTAPQATKTPDGAAPPAARPLITAAPLGVAIAAALL